MRNAAGTKVGETGEETGVPSGPLPAGPSTGGGLRSTLGYDLMGRLISQEDRGWAQGSTFTGVIFSRSIGYNAKGQVTSDDVSTLRSRPSAGGSGYDTFRSVTTYDYDYDYGSGAAYALGSVVSQGATNNKVSYSGSWKRTIC